jgi:phosphotransferase system HPr (HPr) family protein
MLEKTVAVKNSTGLHARPASALVRAISPLSASVKLRKNDMEINAKSIVHILTLEAACGDTITILADGPEQEKAMQITYNIISSQEEDL